VPSKRNLAALSAGLLLTAAAGLAAAGPAQAATSRPSPPRPAAHLTGTLRAGLEKAGVEKASATPMSDSGCDGSLPWDNVLDCIYITGSEDYVQNIYARAHPKNQEVYDATLYIVDPSGTYVAKYGPHNIPVGYDDYISWTPNAVEQTGAWCSELWAGNQEIISECQPVN
jgi:hypothetical protein